MQLSATFSRRRLAIVACAALVATSSFARVLVSVDEALALAFPECETKREAVFLTENEVASAGLLAGAAVSSALAVRYVARRGEELAGTAYLDTHLVRTLEETVMVVVLPDGTVGRVEVISFREPPDYLPREGWYRQFDGRSLDEDLALNQGIRAVTGATLTARATTAAARRVLALHRTIEERAEP